MLRRLLDLVSVEIDHRYQNPLDSALSTYLWCLKEVNSPIGKIAASAAVRAKNTLWVPLVVEEILREGTSTAENSQATVFAFEIPKLREMPILNSRATNVTEWQAWIPMLPSSSSFELAENITTKLSSGDAWSDEGMKIDDLFGRDSSNAMSAKNQTESSTVVWH